MRRSALYLALGLVSLTIAGAIDAGEPAQPDKKLKVVVFGGHPDDPESGAGGLIATLTRQGHEVICAYGTTFRGDRQFFGKPEAEVRRAEAGLRPAARHVPETISARSVAHVEEDRSPRHDLRGGAGRTRYPGPHGHFGVPGGPAHLRGWTEAGAHLGERLVARCGGLARSWAVGVNDSLRSCAVCPDRLRQLSTP